MKLFTNFTKSIGVVACLAMATMSLNASAAFIAAGSEIGFIGGSTVTGDVPSGGTLSVSFAVVGATTGDFDGLVPLTSLTVFADPISWDAGGAITAPAFGESMWEIGGGVVAAFTWDSGVASTTPAGLVELTGTGTMSLVGFDDTAGTFTLNETTLTFSANNMVVPIPAAAWLFGSALLGLAGVARRKKA